MELKIKMGRTESLTTFDFNGKRVIKKTGAILFEFLLIFLQFWYKIHPKLSSIIVKFHDIWYDNCG